LNATVLDDAAGWLAPGLSCRPQRRAETEDKGGKKTSGKEWDFSELQSYEFVLLDDILKPLADE